MGWFSKNITGGDEPMDYESVITEVLGVEDIDSVTKEMFEQNQMVIYNRFKREKVTIIAFQVLAFYMVKVGAKFEKVVKNRIIKCLEKDQWAEESFERWYHINYLLNIINNYQNTPVSPEDNKLFRQKEPKKQIQYLIDIYNEKFLEFYNNNISGVKFVMCIMSNGSGVSAIVDENYINDKEIVDFFNTFILDDFGVRKSIISKQDL